MQSHDSHTAIIWPFVRNFPLQTDPFIQHFNNIFYSNPPYRTFAECEEAIDRLSGILQLPYLGKIEFVEFVSGEQPRFKKINFPGVKALKYDLLAQFYKKITNNELPEGQGSGYYKEQSNYILSVLSYIKDRFQFNTGEKGQC